jgi:VanZ family protein
LSAERDALARWAPALAWAGMIFLASTSWFSGSETRAVVLPLLHWLFPHAEHQTLEVVHAGIRKLGHFTEYLILGLLLANALEADGGWRPRHAILVVTLAMAYAVTDELHQYFVPGRTAAVGDVLIDGAGALVGQVGRALARWR